MNALVTLATLVIDSLVAVFVVSVLTNPTLFAQHAGTEVQPASVSSAFTQVATPSYRSSDFVDLSDVLALAATSTATTSEEIEKDEVAETVAEEPKKDTKKVTSKPAPVVTQKIVTPPPVIVEPVMNSSETYAEAVRIEISKLTNAFREAKNLNRLAYDMKLESGANMYSATLLQSDKLSHNVANCDLTCRFNNNNYLATSWGENLATISFSSRPSAASVAATFMEEWQKSAGHRDNLLSDDFTHQGIGVSLDGDEVYVVVDFAKPTL